MTRTDLQAERIPFWRNERYLQILSQIAFALIVFLLGYFLYQNMVTGLRTQGTTLGFSFLQNAAGFDIAENIIEYSRTSSYWQAFLVGLLNTFVVSVVGIFFSTILGVALGIARLSSNLLVRWLASAYLELIRNLSLLVFLVFIYLGFFLKLPRLNSAINLPGQILLSNRGLAIPWGLPTDTFIIYRAILLAGLLIAAGVAYLLILRGKRTGRTPFIPFWSGGVFLIIALIGWVVLPNSPLVLDFPSIEGLNISGGKVITPEFAALVTGLVLYTAAFIGEVVRAGIQSVSRGQTEAARAIGLNDFQILRLVIFPQALRVIIPPLTSQYLNLAKNSSLAIAVGYSDLFYVSNTIINNSGRAVEMITLVMLTYLSFSLITSLFMNWYNAKIRLVER